MLSRMLDQPIRQVIQPVQMWTPGSHSFVQTLITLRFDYRRPILYGLLHKRHQVRAVGNLQVLGVVVVLGLSSRIAISVK